MTPKTKATKNLMANVLMDETGWNRDRVVAAIEELGGAKLVWFKGESYLWIQQFV